jgi:L-threonylcarbamoyladenylate synthase
MYRTRIQQEAEKATQTVLRGGVILFPTDTIWGLGCDARSEVATERIFNIKQRPKEKSVIVLMRDLTMLHEYCPVLPEDAVAMFLGSERPTTVVLNNVTGLASQVYAPDGSVGIRIPWDPFCSELLTRSACPLVSTSANLSGEPFNGLFTGLSAEIIRSVDFVVNWRREERETARPSRVVKWIESSGWSVLRD